MLAARLARREGAKLLARTLHSSAALLDSAPIDKDGDKKQESPMVFSRPSGSDRALRYYVLKDQPNPALSLLEQALSGTPMPGRPGSKPRVFALPPPGVCNSLLVKAAQDPTQAVRAAEVADSLLQEGTRLDVHTLKALIASLARAGELQAALPVLDAWLQQQEDALAEDTNTQAPLQVMSMLMDTATRAENTQMVLQVLARMARIGVTPSPQSLTTLLQCFMRLGQVHVAHSVLDWMRRNNLEPNVYSYTALLAMPRHLSEAAAAELVEQARAVYRKMREDGVPPNARFFTEYIRICGRAADLAAAQAAWRDAEEAGVEKDLILYSAMIDTCAKCRDPAAAMQVFTQMRREGQLQPDVVAYTSLLSALQGTPQAAAMARQLWAGMRADGVQPNGMAVAAFLEILLLEGEIDEALQTLAAAQQGSQGSRDGRAPRKRSGWQRKSEQWAEAAELEAELADTAGTAGAVGTSGTAGEGLPAAQDIASRQEEGEGSGAVDLPRLYEHFIFAMAHKGQYAVAEQMARHMRSRGLPHTLGTASALLTAQALQQGRAAGKWLLQPAPASQQPGGDGTAASGSAAAVRLPDDAVESCLLGRGSPQHCLEKLLSGQAPDQQAAGGIQPSTTVANVVLAGLAVRGCTADAVRLFDWMQAQRAAGKAGKAGAAGAACAPDWWSHQLLLFAALNAPKEQQLELTLRAVKEAREFGAAAGRGAHRWDARSRAAIAAVMRQSEQARALLASSSVESPAEEREERLQQLRGLLR